MITVTDNALEYIKILRKDPTHSLTVTVLGGGCAGLQYALGWLTFEPGAEFVTLASLLDLNVVSDKKSSLYLEGLVLDYNGGLNGSGFVFTNPNAKRECGCGESFGV